MCGPPSRGETRLFAVAVAALVAHTLAAGLSLQPGVEIREHLSAILIPLAVLGASLLSYPRMRAGARASVSLALGSLGVVGAAVATAAISVEGFGLASVTGILLAPAGIALLGLGAWLLWRSRKPEGRRALRRGLLTLAAALFAFEVLVPIALAIVATHRPAQSPARLDLGRAYQQVRIETSDGLELAASWVPSQNGAAVITLPDRTWTDGQSRMLAEHGYGVLAVDIRGYGASDGDPNAYGWAAARDVDAAVAFLRNESGVDPRRIGGLGLSVGGEVLLQAAAENDGLRAVVSDGAGERSVKETVLYGPRGILAVGEMAVQTAAVAAFSGDLPPPSLADLVGKIAPRAVLLIQAENGGGGEDLNDEYYERAGEPKDLWEVDGASHTEGLETQPSEYEQRVLGFLNRYLAEGP